MTWKKWMYLIIAFAITGYILFFYISFNGNPISKVIAKNHAIDYLEEYYPDKNYSVKDSGYNFKDKSYYFYYIVNEKNDQVYNYTIEIGTGLKPDQIVYHSLRYDSEDVDMSSTFSEAGTSYVKKMLQEANLDSDVYYYVQVPLGYLDSDTRWDPKIELPVNASIHVYTQQSFTSKKEFLHYAESVKEALNGVLYSELHIENAISETKDGVETISTLYKASLQHGQKPALQDIWEAE